MKRLILGVAAALFLSAGQAAADGLPSKGHVRAAEAAPNWNGFYLGVGIGAGAVVHDVTATDRYYPTNSAELDGIGGEGIFGTVTLGYDRVIRPGWVGGIFVDYDFSNISTDASISNYYSSASTSLDHNSSWSVGGRLGFLTNPSTLLYGTAGYTQAQFDVFGSDQTFDGYFVGAGVETFLRENWTLKLEYRFSQFNEESFDSGCYRVDLEPSMHTARLVLSYKFGHRD